MNITHRLPSTPLIAAALGLGLAMSACAPAESEYVGEDRSGLTEQVDARSPVVPGPEDDPTMVDDSMADEMADDEMMADTDASE